MHIVAAQVSGITGEYKMTGNHDMVSVFVFNEDNNFEYYFMYGAVDRKAHGIYERKGDSLVLHGTKIPGQDFTSKGSRIDTPGTTIVVTCPIQALIKNVQCIFEKGSQQDIQYTDSEGLAHSLLEDCDNIFVMHLLYKDSLTAVVKGRTKEDHNNRYELTLNPSLEEICLKDIKLVINGDTLTGSLPYLWEQEKSVFIKQ